MLVGCTMLNPGFDLDADGGATDGEPGPTGEDPTDDGGTTETDEPPDMLPDDTSGGEECGNGIVEGDELCDDAQLPNGTCLNCAEVECAKGFENCNAVAEDGCEVDLFSTAHSCGYCGHDCLGGACEDGMCQPYLLAEAQGAPYDLIVDDKNAYWVNRSFNTVMQTAKDGGGPVEQVAGGQNGPTGITEHAGKLYWADFYDGEIVRGALGDQIGPFAQAQSNPFSITNDAERVCWTNFGNGSIACKTLDGNIAGTLTTGQPQPWGITSLPGELFWSTAAAEGSIQYLPEGDVEPTPLAVALGLELGGL